MIRKFWIEFSIINWPAWWRAGTQAKLLEDIPPAMLLGVLLFRCSRLILVSFCFFRRKIEFRSRRPELIK